MLCTYIASFNLGSSTKHFTHTNGSMLAMQGIGNNFGFNVLPKDTGMWSHVVQESKHQPYN